MATSTISALLEQEIRGFTTAKADQSFAELGLDSFAMLELRVAIERAVGGPIADEVWVKIATPSQLLMHMGDTPAQFLERPPTPPLTVPVTLPGPFEVRRVQSADAPELESFSMRLWPRRDPAVLAQGWWLKASPAQCFAAFSVSNGSIGGICGARAQRVFLRGAPARAVGICDWFVDPATRGSGIGRRLAEAALGGADVGWSSSLSTEAESAFLKLGFSPVPAQRMPLFLSPAVIVAARNALRFRSGRSVETRDFSHATLGSIAAEIEQARALRQDDQFTGGARDLDAWRSHLMLVPNRIYRAYILRNRQAELVAFAVSRRLARGGFPRLGPTRLTLIGDLLCDPSQRQQLAPLFRRMAFDAIRAGSELLLYPAHDPPMHETLAQAGFFSALDSCMNLRIPRLATRFMTRQSIVPGIGAAQWRITAFDCDYDLAFGEVAAS